MSYDDTDNVFSYETLLATLFYGMIYYIQK